MFFLFKDFAATLFSFEVWIAYLRLSESAKLDILNGWLNKNTFPTWRLAWSQSWEDTNWLIWPILNKKICNKNFWIESDHYFPKNSRFENFKKALTPCCQCCQCVSYEVTEGRYQCVCLLYAGRFPIITNIGLWTLLTDIVPHAMQRVVLFEGGNTKKTCNSHFSFASWSTAKFPDMSKTLGQSKRFPKLLFNLQFSTTCTFL